MVRQGPHTAPNRELLEATHEFPGEYILKAFGPNAEAFCAAIRGCAEAVVGMERFVARDRTSSKGNKVCVTLTLSVERAEEVLAVYRRIHAVPDLRLIL